LLSREKTQKSKIHLMTVKKGKGKKKSNRNQRKRRVKNNAPGDGEKKRIQPPYSGRHLKT